MTDRELVSEIKQRFRFTTKDIRTGLAGYELNLIYDVFPSETPNRIKHILKKYSTGELVVTNINGSVKYKKSKNIQRGVLPGTLVM